MDRWVILADSFKQGCAWIKKHLHIFEPKKMGGKWITVAPFFDLDDPFEVMVVVDRQDFYNKNFYRMIDVRTELTRTHDAVLEGSSRLYALEASLRHHPQGPKFQHPHPEPPTWEALDRYDMYRRWISPDPFPISKVKTRLFPPRSALRKNTRDL